MLDELLIQSRQIVENVPLDFKRYLHSYINWNNRLIAIKGARGAGKTTLLLQYIAEKLPNDHTVLYISMEDMFFYKNSLLSLANEFVLNGGQYLFLDEVHKYPNWSRELKLIHDRYRQLHVVFTSSSLLEINKARYDLSRRAVAYYLEEMSLREYIHLKFGIALPSYHLDEILANHTEIAYEITSRIKPVFVYNQYVKHGAYPFFAEGEAEYERKLTNVLNLTLENDLPAVYNVDFYLVFRIKKLMYAIATSAPFKPNISKLSEKTGISRPTLLSFLDYLEKAELIYQLRSPNKGVSSLAKPDKIYLHNVNLIRILAEENYNTGNIRETFFLNQVSTTNSVYYSSETDFFVNNALYFEIGGKNKGQKQIRNLGNAYVVKDRIETGVNNVIPLWLFGFLY